MNVFTYGSLMYSRIWDRVVTGDYASCRATLCGFRRNKVKDATYPGIFPGDGEVDGMLYFNVSPEDLKTLDEFEGEFYRKNTGFVHLQGGIPLIACYYVFADDFAHMLTDEEWSPEEFAAEGINRFIYEWMEPYHRRSEQNMGLFESHDLSLEMSSR